jgi:hypothetical protein
MIDIEIYLDTEGETENPLLCEHELQALLDNTRVQVREHIQRRLGDTSCAEHGQSPKIIVNGVYALDTEQLELSYNIDACCNQMTMQTAARLSRS